MEASRLQYERPEPVGTAHAAGRCLLALSKPHADRASALQAEPYRPLADEVFYDGALAIWSRNRFFIGISKRVSGTLAIDCDYMRQNDHYSQPGDIHALGLQFRLQAPSRNQ